MKIQKKYQGAIPLNRIANEYDRSTTNTYSTDYINDNLSPYKNLFHLRSCSSANSNTTILSDNAFSMSVDGVNRGIFYVTITNLKPQTVYTFSYDVENSNPDATPGIDGYWVKEDGTEVYNTALSGYPTSFTFNTYEYTTVRMRMYITYAIMETVGTFSNIQLEEGDKRTVFSPTCTSNKKEVYSDVERVIGVWMNKPLYQKTMVITLGDGITSNQFNLNIPNIDYIYIDSGNSSIKFKDMSFVQLGFYSGSTDFSRAYIDGGKTVGGITLGSAYTTGKKTIYLTLKYTKMTD